MKPQDKAYWASVYKRRRMRSKVGVPAAKVLALVAVCFDLPADEVLAPGRTIRCARARQAAVFLMRDRLGMSYPEIALEIGRDHSTMISAYRSAIAHAETSPAFKAALGEMGRYLIGERRAFDGL